MEKISPLLKTRLENNKINNLQCINLTSKPDSVELNNNQEREEVKITHKKLNLLNHEKALRKKR